MDCSNDGWCRCVALLEGNLTFFEQFRTSIVINGSWRPFKQHSVVF